MTYTIEMWADELKTYRSSKRAARETLEGAASHIDEECLNGATQMVHSVASPVGLAERDIYCDRGTRGCNKQHNDLDALRFTRMGLERVVELQRKGK